jgi:hypothetical protein
MVPLGYETKDRRIVVVEEEAERVRTIFRRYLDLGSLNRLMPHRRPVRFVGRDWFADPGVVGAKWRVHE